MKMKRWLALLLLATAGCSSLNYTNATSGDSFTYTRLGTSKIAGLTVEPLQDGGHAVELRGFESDGSAPALSALSAALLQAYQPPSVPGNPAPPNK